MLAKKFRLPVKEFLLKKPKIIKTPNFCLKYLPNQLPFNRGGVIISKKIEKSSVRRNRVKRMIFEYLRQGENIPKAGIDILILPASKIFKLKPDEIKKKISQEIILDNNLLSK